MKQSYTDTNSTQLTRYTEHNYTHTFHTFKIPSVDEKKIKIKWQIYLRLFLKNYEW